MTEAPKPFVAVSAKSFVERLPIVFFAGSMLLWLASISQADQQQLNDFGLISILPPTYWIGVLLLTAGFLLELLRGDRIGFRSFIHILGLIIYLHLTPCLIYETLRYSWAWRHLGIVDYIQSYNTIDRAAFYLPAYHDWPGLFWVTAKILNAFDKNVLDFVVIAKFASPVSAILSSALTAYIARQLTANRQAILLTTWIYLTANWIGQDYYSPQSVAFILYLLAVGLCLGPLRKAEKQRSLPHWFLPKHFGLSLSNAISASTETGPAISSKIQLLLPAVFVFLCIVINTTHQLTPLALILSLAFLSAMGVLRFAYVAFAAAVWITWVLYFAAPFVEPRLIEELANFGEGLNASSGRLADLASVSAGRAWGIVAGRLHSVILVLAAALGVLRRHKEGRHDILALTLAASTLPLFANRYGGEIMFRVYMFSTPFLSCIASHYFLGRSQVNLVGRRKSLILLYCIFSVFGFLCGNNGKDKQFVYTQDEVDVAKWLYTTAPKGSLIVEGSRYYPAQFINYASYFYTTIAEESLPERFLLLDKPETTLLNWMSNGKWKSAFVIITNSQKSYTDAEGILPPGSLDVIERQLMSSPLFTLVKSSRSAKVFSLTHDKHLRADPGSRDLAPRLDLHLVSNFQLREKIYESYNFPRLAEGVKGCQSCLAKENSELEILQEGKRLEGIIANSGYLDGKVHFLPADQDRKTTVHRGTLLVDSGPPYFISGVTISAAGDRSVVDELETVATKYSSAQKGHLAETQVLLATERGIREFLDARDFPAAELTGLSYVRDKGLNTATLEVSVELKGKMLFGSVSPFGTRRFDATTLAGLAGFKTGDDFSQEKLRAYEHKLMELGEFQSVSMKKRLSSSRPDQVDILVNIKDKPANAHELDKRGGFGLVLSLTALILIAVLLMIGEHTADPQIRQALLWATSIAVIAALIAGIYRVFQLAHWV